MNVSNWILGDFKGSRFIEVNERRWDKKTMDMCDYVMVNGVKFINAQAVVSYSTVKDMQEQELYDLLFDAERSLGLKQGATRAFNVLYRAGCRAIQDLHGLDLADAKAIEGCGNKTMALIREAKRMLDGDAE